MSDGLTPVERPPLLHIAVQGSIRAYILNNNLQAGDQLPTESELTRRLGVSRTSIREAIRGLESLGVLETRRGSGVFVRSFSFEPLLNNLPYGLLFDLNELSELLQIRRILESGMLDQAMAAMTEEQINKLQDSIDQMYMLTKQGKRFPHEDRAFHYYLFEHLGNQTFLKLIDMFWLAFNMAIENNILSQKGDPTPTYRDHVRIVEAIRGGNVDEVRTALEQHYRGLARFVSPGNHLSGD